MTDNDRPDEDDGKHDGLPRDEHSREPLGPLTPDPGRPLGDTAEAHDEIAPQDLPLGHPARKATEKAAAREGGTTRGDV